MTATYQLSLDELQPSFVDQLKQMHQNGQVKVTVEVLEEHDETEFLLRNPKNRERLMEAIKNVEAGKVVEVDEQYLDDALARLVGE